MLKWSLPLIAGLLLTGCQDSAANKPVSIPPTAISGAVASAVPDGVPVDFELIAEYQPGDDAGFIGWRTIIGADGRTRTSFVGADGSAAASKLGPTLNGQEVALLYQLTQDEKFSSLAPRYNGAETGYHVRLTVTANNETNKVLVIRPDLMTDNEDVAHFRAVWDRVEELAPPPTKVK